MKADPEKCSLEDVVAAKKSTALWIGERDYQARNFMRDSMQVGDDVPFYHSSCDQQGIVGIGQLMSEAYPDLTQFDPNSPYQDANSKPEEPHHWKVIFKMNYDDSPRYTCVINY